jgi:hypothetical protein
LKDATGKWVGWGLGDVDPKVADIQKFLARNYHATAGSLVATGTYDQFTADTVARLQENLIRNGKYKGTANGVLNYDTQVALGYVKLAPPPPAAPKVIGFSVEGHLSDMWRGPAADTLTILHNERRLHHQPTGYENGAIPFNNRSGVEMLASFYRSDKLPDGTPVPSWYEERPRGLLTRWHRRLRLYHPVPHARTRTGVANARHPRTAGLW